MTVLRFTLTAALLLGTTPLTAQSLLPIPASMTPGAGSFTVADGTRIGAPASDAGANTATKLLAEHVKRVRGLTLVPGATGPVRFVRDTGIKGDEAYRLTVTSTGIVIAASGDRGLVHGAMTLAQLVSPDAQFGRPVTVAATTIADAPRFGWRGLMIDPARHFLPMPALRAIVDQMAAVKLNSLHLHLTDDQGWRFEVKRYPKLTEIGGFRTPPSTGGDPGPKVGGFYTQEELKALVVYARDRGITIVPEIDLPGHAQALVAAYPELGLLGDRPEVSNNWGIMPYLFNPGPKGIAFVKAVLDEVMDVFPGTYIHLGGDEAVKDQWERSADVQAQIRALGLKDENALQSWMIDQFGTYLQSKGRRLIGWDEILEGGLPASASIMSWRGEKGGIDAANLGHDVVMSPGTPMYLNYTQSDLSDEPPGRFDVLPLDKVYQYDPMPVGIAPDRERHVLGAQANLWSEYIATRYQLQHHIFPRAAAVAEVTWAQKGGKDFAAFLPRAHQQGERWKRAGMQVADSAFAVDIGVDGTRGDALRRNSIPLTLKTQAPYGTIRYTTDGSTPTARSKAYAATLSVKPGTVIRAAAFDAAGMATATPRSFDTARAALLSRSSSDMRACPNGSLGLRPPLTSESTANAPAFNINLFDTCTLYPDAPLDIARGYAVDVVRLARHYGLAHEARMLREHYNVTDHGELLVQVGCVAAAAARKAGDKTARPVAAGAFPLPDPKMAPQRFTFKGTLPNAKGDQDICFQFTSPLSDPYYTVERVQLTEGDR
ncbi:family 20 glycosylhydrolase [Microvirga sp. SRT01]|uniref:beta-N-acetylhexosaminidase n=1 Tax=Sphingomonas longa TaxID=2778730 RepID=A0ABS2DAC8_9SPHN|nr:MULTISPECIES: family 20 glycosylhydrolase [Alphaproteobacteria]MBM6577902.1 family 20 glycosylhydrolase [Sphingomonas sp. BT552]MBR7710943.1 family 20 glycosylhydrolase [Microvirga sp. SRT01]